MKKKQSLPKAHKHSNISKRNDHFDHTSESFTTMQQTRLGKAPQRVLVRSLNNENQKEKNTFAKKDIKIQKANFRKINNIINRSQTSEKLQKILANAGLGSRREIETWISDGRIKVNGLVAKLGDRITTDAKIHVDGRIVRLDQRESVKRRVLLYHKPVGEVCTRNDPEGRPTVFDNLPKLRGQRWIAIGRLDLNTAGLLLFTNDGELAHRLMHPSNEIEREYAVRVFGEVSQEILQQLKKGVELDDGLAHFDEIYDAGGTGLNHWYHVILKEGRKREVRRMWESQGVKVSRLIRVRFADIQLPRFLRFGKFSDLEPEQITALAEAVGLA